jgi:DNA-binding CsgD family transcriptional regulator
MNRPIRFFLGHSFLVAWTQLLYTDSVLLLPPQSLVPLQITHLFSTLSVIATSLAVLLMAASLAPLSKRRELLFLVGVIGAAATAAIPLVSSGQLDSYMVIPCVTLTAASGFWIAVVWVETISTQGVRGTLITLVITAALGSVLAALISQLPAIAAICLTVLLPIASTFSLRPLPREQLMHYGVPRPTIRKLLEKTPIRLIVVAGILNSAFGVVKTLDLLNSPTLDLTVAAAVSLVFTLLSFVIAGGIAFFAYRVNTIIAFYIAIPISALAALLIILPGGLPLNLPFFIANTGIDLINLLVLLLLIKSCAEYRIPLLFCYSLLKLSQFAGALVGQIFTVIVSPSLIALTLGLLLILITAVLVLIGSYATLSVADQNVQTGSVGKNGAVVTDISARVQKISDKAGLSPRELEILTIWATGHNSLYIEKSLQISKNTVKTHLAHIYAKTNTANREELLVLLDTYK